MINVKNFIFGLHNKGFVFSISEDHSQIKIVGKIRRLHDRERKIITEHKTLIMAYLNERDLNPKVLKGAIHWIAHRSQRHITRLSQLERLKLTVLLSDSRTEIMEQYTTLVDLNKQPYTKSKEYSERLKVLTNSLTAYYRAVRAYVSCVTNVQRTPTV